MALVSFRVPATNYPSYWTLINHESCHFKTEWESNCDINTNDNDIQQSWLLSVAVPVKEELKTTESVKETKNFVIKAIHLFIYVSFR